jgi:hypothetical protein
MLEVHADIYNLELPTTIKHGWLTISRKPDYQETIKEKLTLQRPTCEAVITLCEEISDRNKAIEGAENYVRLCARLIALAEGHQTFFFQRQIRSAQETTRTIQFSTEKSGRSVFNLSDFIEVSLSILDELTNNQKKTIEQALLYREVGEGMQTIESRHSMFFIALEVLASTFYSKQRDGDGKKIAKKWLLEDTIWSSLESSVRQNLIDLKVNEDDIESFMCQFRDIEDPPIRDKIISICWYYGLPNYSTDIAAMAIMRNDILHGNQMRAQYKGIDPTRVITKCYWLLLKLLFKTLNYYEPQKLNVMIANEEL